VDQRIDPEKVGAPFQFLAAALVFIVLLDGSFLSAAAVIEKPSWAAAVLVISAVVNVPLLLIGMFVLQTRFRAELLGDQQYVELQKTVQRRTEQLRLSNDAAGIDLYGDFRFEAERNLHVGQQLYLTRYGRELERALDEHRTDLDEQTIASASRELARAAAAHGDWMAASEHLQTTAEADPDDWGAWFALATSLANVRGGREIDARALDAMEKAIDLAPNSLERSQVLRMRSYRAALLKRLGQTDRALHELLLIQAEAEPGTYEADDIAYNLACIHALAGEGRKAVAQLQRIRDDRFLLGAASHRHDYFASLIAYEPFADLIAKALARMEGS
jgi:tetratricopeptide (TPR) repeat protein